MSQRSELVPGKRAVPGLRVGGEFQSVGEKSISSGGEAM